MSRNLEELESEVLNLGLEGRAQLCRKAYSELGCAQGRRKS